MNSKHVGLIIALLTSPASATAATPDIAVRIVPLFAEAVVGNQHQSVHFVTVGIAQVAAHRDWWAIETDLRLAVNAAWFQSVHGGLRVPMLGASGQPGPALALNLMGGIVGGVQATRDDGYRQREVVFGPQGVAAIDLVFRGSRRAAFSLRLYGDYQHWAVNTPTHYGWRTDPYSEYYKPTKYRLYVGLMFGVEFAGLAP